MFRVALSLLLGLSLLSQPNAANALELHIEGLRPEVLDLAVRAYECGERRGYWHNSALTIIDYSLPSTAKRLWVVDLRSGTTLFHERVAHGAGSGDTFAVAFSDTPGSRKTSIGLFRTGNTYKGRHGYSLTLEGLEPKINARAYSRRIVIHPATYVSKQYLASHDTLGRSWGCPAVDPAVAPGLINAIKDGSAVFAYYPDASWLRHSEFLSCAASS